jgi:hypothetical protein
MVWSMLAIILAIIAVLILAMLLFPVTIYINSARSGGKIYGSFGISWMLFQFRYALKERQTEILFFGRRVVSWKRKPSKPEKPKKPERVKKIKKKPSIRDIFDLSMPTLQLFKDLIRAFRLKYLDIDITYGLDDPGYTGMLTGFLYAVRGSLQLGNNIRLEPDFTGQVLDWNMKAKASIIPVRIIPPVARFVTDREVLRAGWKSIRG